MSDQHIEHPSQLDGEHVSVSLAFGESGQPMRGELVWNENDYPWVKVGHVFVNATHIGLIWKSSPNAPIL